MMTATVAAVALEEEAFAHGKTTAETADPALSLWYSRPATEGLEKKWLEALPVGNGRLGAMVFGDVASERLQLNEGTVWAGGPHDYANPDGPAALPEIRRLIFAGEWVAAQQIAEQKFNGKPQGQAPYQTIGNLNFMFSDGTAEVTEYRRSLDLSTAIAHTGYTVNGVRHTREVFASYPDQVIVVRLTANRPGIVTFLADFSTPMKASSSQHDSRTIVLAGKGSDAGGTPGAVRFTALARAHAEGGTVAVNGDQLVVTGADSVTLLISMASSYRNFADVSGDADAIAKTHLEAASKRTSTDCAATISRITKSSLGASRLRWVAPPMPRLARPMSASVPSAWERQTPALSRCTFSTGAIC